MDPSNDNYVMSDNLLSNCDKSTFNKSTHLQSTDITENGTNEDESNISSCHTSTPMVSRLNIGELKNISVYYKNNHESNENTKADYSTENGISNNGNYSTDIIMRSNEIILEEKYPPESNHNDNCENLSSPSSSSSSLTPTSASSPPPSPSHDINTLLPNENEVAKIENVHQDNNANNTMQSTNESIKDITPLIRQPMRSLTSTMNQSATTTDIMTLLGLHNDDDDEYIDNDTDPDHGEGDLKKCTKASGYKSQIYHQPPKAICRHSAQRLARRLYTCDGFKITDVAKHLCKRNDFSQIVGEEFANFFEFTSVRLDEALRQFLSKFTLTGETQERERIMHHFSRRYVICNPYIYNGEDSCHTLVCALIILNTNLHSQIIPKMTCSDFINNLKDLNDGDNFPHDNLEELFNAIEKEPIRWPIDDELVNIVNIPKPSLDQLDVTRQYVNPHFQFIPSHFDVNPQESNCREFMRGYIVRKWLKEPGGRKTSFVKRSWRLYYARLRDLTIHLYKDHKDPQVTKSSMKKVNNEDNGTGGSTENVGLQNSLCDPSDDNSVASTASSAPPTQNSLVLPPASCVIHVHHAIASRATDYLKKKFVLRLRTKYGCEYLFEVTNEKELNGWIDNINYAAALLSDPEPIIGINTMQKISSKSIPLPKITTLTMRDQLESHQKCVLDLEKTITNLRENTNNIQTTNVSDSKRMKSEFEEAIRFRSQELQRYKIYSQLLDHELLKMSMMMRSTSLSSAANCLQQSQQQSIPNNTNTNTTAIYTTTSGPTGSHHFVQFISSASHQSNQMMFQQQQQQMNKYQRCSNNINNIRYRNTPQTIITPQFYFPIPPPPPPSSSSSSLSLPPTNNTINTSATTLQISDDNESDEPPNTITDNNNIVTTNTNSTFYEIV